MKAFYRKYRLLILLSALAGCVGSQLYQAVPTTIDRAAVPKQTIEITAKDYEYIPDTIKVKAGTLLTLKVKSIEGTHGFEISAFGINEKLEEGKTVVIELYAANKGEYTIKCSHFCGLGHFGMHGKLVVE